MNANDFSQKDYENKSRLRTRKNKPKQTQSQRQDEKNPSGRLFLDRMRFLYPVRKPAL
jgi:hypothetical protein